MGDLVRLGPRAPAEFRGQRAVVARVAKTSCAAVALDASCSFTKGERATLHSDLVAENQLLRIGARVLIDGLRDPRTKRLNGYTAIFCVHPRAGHPLLVRTKRPLFNACNLWALSALTTHQQVFGSEFIMAPSSLRPTRQALPRVSAID